MSVSNDKLNSERKQKLQEDHLWRNDESKADKDKAMPAERQLDRKTNWTRRNKIIRPHSHTWLIKNDWKMRCYLCLECRCDLAAWSVLCKTAAIVIGPNPPGTGVIAAAFCDTPSKSTSPTVLKLPGLSLSGITFMPTSRTTAPGFTQSAFTACGLPTATTRMSARLHHSFVCEL